MCMKSLTECEVVVMKSIWASDHPIALPEIIESVNTTFGKNWKPQTVSTFLTRLVKKEFLSMKRHGRTFLYTPIVSELDYGKREVGRCAELWYNNDADIFLTLVTDRRRLTAEEIDRIRKLIEKSEG